MPTISLPAPRVIEGRARAAFIAGVRDITPMVIGVLPFGLAIGTAIASSDIGIAAGIASAVLIFAGAAQLTTVQMLDAGISPFVIIVSALMINARLLLYSTSLAPWFRDEPLKRRLLLAAPVIDQMHFTCVPRFERGGFDATERRSYYIGAAVLLLGAWTAVQAIAIVVGARLPDSLGLHVAAPLALVGLLAKSTVNSTAVIAASVAAIVSVAGVGLPFRSAVLVATLIGIATAMITNNPDRHTEKSS